MGSLFDEVDKGHPNLFNKILQMFEAGQLTDQKGREISFKNIIILRTSNVGARRIMKGDKDEKSEEAKKQKHRSLRPLQC